jgi:hypothetical protein
MDWSKQVLYRENYVHVLRTFVIIAWSYWADSAAAVGSASGTILLYASMLPGCCCTDSTSSVSRMAREHDDADTICACTPTWLAVLRLRLLAREEGGEGVRQGAPA